MAEPTPGPWTYQRTRDGVEVLGARGELIHIEDAGAIPDHLDEASKNRLWAETMANARLIAKARHLPELVEALESLLGKRDIGMRFDHRIKKAEAALALVQDKE